MKIKKMVIQIKPDREIFDELKGTWDKLEKGQPVKTTRAVYFESIDAMRKVLTEERLKALHTIKAKRPTSIYALAKLLKRDFKNTHDDVVFLAGAGFIDLKKSKTGRRSATPAVNYERITLEIVV